MYASVSCRISALPLNRQFTVHFNADIDPTIRDHLSGTNGKAAAAYVTFPNSPDRSHFFVAGKTQGAWNAVLPDYHVQKLLELQGQLPEFDRAVTGVLYGKGKTNITLFRGGFAADFDDEINSEEHPLYKVRFHLYSASYMSAVTMDMS
jgi:hypothetical protein